MNKLLMTNPSRVIRNGLKNFKKRMKEKRKLVPTADIVMLPA
jgi:hypothetical protein